MPNNDIESIAIDTYNKNMEYLKEHEKELFDKLKLYELGIELKEIKSGHELEYKDDYFDILDNKTNNFYYNQNSAEYSKERVSKINFNAETNSFRTFYDVSYEKELGDNAKNLSIYSHFAFGNAPVINYVNNNLPQKQIMKNMYIYIIFGVGLGLHISQIDKKVNARLYLIIEPSLEIFRLSLFVTNYVQLTQSKIVVFSISENKQIFEEKFSKLHRQYHSYNHYLKFFLFSNNCESYIKTIQTVLVSQSYNLYSYDRSLQSLKRTYDYVIEKFNFFNVSEDYSFEVFNNKPVLFLASGPSVQKEIDFLIENQNKFIIVSILTMVNFLEKHKIIPNVIVQYDETPIVMKLAINKIKDKDFFSDTLFFFSSHVHKNLMHSFPKDNIYVYNALFEAKKGFSFIVSPSVGEISYHILLKLGANNIYILGLDMSYDPDTGKSHHDENHDQIGSKNNNTEESLANFNLRKNILRMKGNFIDEVETMAVFKVSINHINIYTKKYKKLKKLKLFNLSNGVYLEGMTPLRAKNITLEDKKELNKKFIRAELVKSLESISGNDFSEADLIFNKGKLAAAYRLKENFEAFYIGIKYSSSEKFLELLTSYYKELARESECKDLNLIIENYCQHNIGYMFYFMNIKNIANPKKHIKYLVKAFSTQVQKIISAYIDVLKKVKN
ncbi:MAG: hypothetical protein COA66_13615 [Arcobacter sp.]|nr:MAG: hypothetical protein COA66_13615 [Arcobacter sp.]